MNLAHPHLVPGFLRPYQVAQRLKIPAHWIYDRIRNGTIEIEKDPHHKTVLFPDDPKTLRLFRQLRAGKLDRLKF